MERDNNKMKQLGGAANPRIEKAGRLLQQYEATATDKYHNSKKTTAKPPYRKTEVQAREVNLKQMKQFLSEGSITF